MRSAVESDAVAGGVAGPGAGGIVPRPRLFERLAAPARVTVVSGPPGSGKTVLLRSWIGQAGLAGRAAWVPVGRGEGDPQQFWLSVLGALRQTGLSASGSRSISIPATSYLHVAATPSIVRSITAGRKRICLSLPGPGASPGPLFRSSPESCLKSKAG
jgi:hypothetical protein